MNNNNINNINLHKLNTNKNNPIKIYTIYKKNEKKIKYKYGNFESTFKVQKYYSKSQNDNIVIDINGGMSSGASATVFLDIDIKDKIFKEIHDENGKEFKALLFQYFMQKYYKYSDKDKLKYLCMLDEFGEIIIDDDFKQILFYETYLSKKREFQITNNRLKNFENKIFNNNKKYENISQITINNKTINKSKAETISNISKYVDEKIKSNSITTIEYYYAIMENCGTDLSKYFSELKNNNLQKLLNIFKECCEAVKIIHDLGYLHLDIKPQNFLISNKEQIKIIDFGESQKVGYKTKYYIGTPYYIANDWMKNYLSEPKIETTLLYHHDIFALGCMFVELLFKYVLYEKKFDMVCPLKELLKSINNTIINKKAKMLELTKKARKEYDIVEHNYMLELMKKANISGNIITLIDHMVNPYPFYRLENINQVIKILNNNYNNDKIEIKKGNEKIHGEILFKRNDFTLNNIKVGKEISGGSYATIYKIDNKYVYKEYKDENYFDKEMNGLKFHAFLESEYKDDKLKYLCKLYEFGTIDNKILYGIMENCGIDTYEYIIKIIQKKSGVPQIIFKEIFKVFKECCEAVKIIHDLGYLHLDIKPNNFMIKDNQIKIIDFGESHKVGYKTTDSFGTKYYIANNRIEKNSKEETTLQYHHDIFSLGYTFVDILYRLCKYLKGESINKEPENESLNQLKARRNSHKEYVKTYFEKNFEKKFKKNNIITLIDQMVDPNPNKRYQNINYVITQINSIIEDLKK